ncbi:MAG: hypothetical protein HKN32_05230 [Flavobacteriales bacterium]|nr:hypothetical protein [Flavobacteriales bacterium]
MRNWLKLSLALVGLSTILFACKKTPEFVNPVYKCECGTMNWNGTEFALSMAEYINVPDSALLSRRYYTTADVQLEGEFEPHNLNLTIEVDTVIKAVFFVEADPDLIITLEEVNFNNPLLPVREYAVTSGSVEIAANVLGGPETVNFNLVAKETFDGIPVGFDIPLVGTMTVTIEN